VEFWEDCGEVIYEEGGWAKVPIGGSSAFIKGVVPTQTLGPLLPGESPAWHDAIPAI
jgi:hypothetical protein